MKCEAHCRRGLASCRYPMKPAAKARAPPAQDAKPLAPRRVSEARTVAPKVGNAQQSRPQPDGPESRLPALFPTPEFAHPALSGLTKDGRSSDPAGAPAIEAELVQDAAPVSKRDSVVSAAGRPAGPQPASESRKPPERSQALSAPEIDHPRVCCCCCCTGCLHCHSRGFYIKNFEKLREGAHDQHSINT